MQIDEKGTKALAGVFSRESIDQVRNPEKLNEYIRVASPGTWILAAALVLVLAALVTWGFVGRIPAYFQIQGISFPKIFLEETSEDTETEEGISKVYCIVNPRLASSIALDKKDAVVLFTDGTRATGTVFAVSATPSSAEEVKHSLQSYAIDSDYVENVLGLNQSDYWYELIIEMNEVVDLTYWGALAQVNIVASQNAPISYLFR